MLKLLKYEFMRRRKNMSIAIGLFCLLEIIVIILLSSKHETSEYLYQTIGLGLYFLTVFVGLIYILVESMILFRNDIHESTGYMLFLTPQSPLKLLGAKTIVVLIQGSIGLVLYLVTCGINYLFNLFQIKGQYYTSNYEIVLEQLSNFKLSFLVFSIILGCIVILAWTNMILTIFFSQIVGKSLLKNVKHSGIFSFILFLVMNVIIARVYLVFGKFINMSLLELNFSKSLLRDNLLLSEFIIILVFIGLILISSMGYLLNKKSDIS